MIEQLKNNRELLNKAEIARRIGISRTYVSLVLSGKRKGKRPDEIMRQITELVNHQLKAA